MTSATHPVALVTGAGQGIGAVIAQTLAERGYDIALHYWDNEDGALALAKSIQAAGRRVAPIRQDLALAGGPKRVVEETVMHLGRIDGLVNNAGITVKSAFLDTSEEVLEACYRVDFLAPYLCAQRAAEWMIKQGIPGALVNITSVHQERSTDWDSAYGSMKAALARLTESMAFELAPHGIRANAIAPGRIRTQDTPLTPFDEAVSRAIPAGRSGLSRDIANAAAWLLSTEASFVTGVTLRVDGGMNVVMTQALLDNRLTFF